MNPDTSMLVVVSHVTHYMWQGRTWAYGPYARELDIWCDLFANVAIAAPVREAQPPDDAAALTRDNVSLRPQFSGGGDTVLAKIVLLARMPFMVMRLALALRGADAIHIRCPGNLGLLGILLAPLFSRRLVAKYAGQWCGYPGEARSYRLQRRLLGSPWWRGFVTVYGDWPQQPAKVVPFFTSVLDDEQVARASHCAAQRSPGNAPRATLRLLFVGRLSKAKNVHAVIDAVHQLGRQDIKVQATLVGEGPERARLEDQVQRLGVSDRVFFTGGVPFDTVLDCYERNDVLILISQTEGWPKAIAEAMAFGLVAIGSNRGLVPEMLSEKRGIVIEPGDAAALAATLAELARAPDRRLAMARNAATWGQRYSLESLRAALGDLMAERWGIPRSAFRDRRAAP